MTRYRILLLCVVICVTALYGPVAFAQIHIQVSPQILEIVVSPGGTVNERLLFTNAGPNPLEVSLELADFEVSDGGNAVKFPAGTQAYSLAPFIRVTPVRALIEPGQALNFRVVARMPDEFEHRRVMLYFLARPDLEDSQEGPRTVVVPKIGIPIYVESRRAPAASLVVEDVQWERLEDGLLELSMTTTNTGRRIIRPPGFVEISSVDGGFYEVFDLNAGADPVLPGHQRKWTFAVGPVPGGELSARVSFATTLRESFVRKYEVPESSETDPGS